MSVLAEETTTLSVEALRDGRDEAMAELHALLLRAARFELHRRRSLPYGDAEDLALQAANDAMVALLGKLDTFRGESRFTTWAYKFALLEAAAKVRRRAWQGRDLPLEPETWAEFESPAPTPAARLERAQLLAAIQEGIESALTPRQRQVLVALALNGVPIDVLAERLDSNRNALYKSLHDARRNLRAHLEAHGLTGGW